MLAVTHRCLGLTTIVCTALVGSLAGAQLPDELTARAEQGDPAAQNDLGSRYYAGRGVAQDEAAALAWIRRSAEQGYAPGEYNLGLMYFRGRGVEGDDEEAAVWYRRAADQGYPPAQAGLGFLYEYGSGVEMDLVEAYKWVELATAGALEEFSRRLYAGKRSELGERLTPEQIAEAERRAAAWTPTRDSPLD